MELSELRGKREGEKGAAADGRGRNGMRNTAVERPQKEASAASFCAICSFPFLSSSPHRHLLSDPALT